MDVIPRTKSQQHSIKLTDQERESLREAMLDKAENGIVPIWEYVRILTEFLERK